WLRVFLAARSPGVAIGLVVEPKVLTLGPGGSEDVHVTARQIAATDASTVAGTLTIAPLAGEGLRVPWAVVTARVSPTLIGAVQLSSSAFKPSDVSPAVLLVQLGRVRTGSGGVALEPVLRLDIHLLGKGGKDLGLLARLRDVLPGRYAFGLTGRGP